MPNPGRWLQFGLQWAIFTALQLWRFRIVSVHVIRGFRTVEPMTGIEPALSAWEAQHCTRATSKYAGRQTKVVCKLCDIAQQYTRLGYSPRLQ